MTHQEEIEQTFFKLHQKTEEELSSTLKKLIQEEKRLSQKRHFLHQKIDSLRIRLIEKLKRRKSLNRKEINKSVEALLKGEKVVPVNQYNLDEKEIGDINFSQASAEELSLFLKKLLEEEAKISYKRRLIHGKIDILKTELLDRIEKNPDDLHNLKDLNKLIKKITKILCNGF